MSDLTTLMLPLSADERAVAESFISRRLKQVTVEQKIDLTLLAESCRSVVKESQQVRARLDEKTRYGKIVARHLDAASSGLALLAAECHRQSERLASEEVQGIEDDSAEDGFEELETAVSEEEEDRAYAAIETRVTEMDTPELKELRDSAEELLGWWQSDQGQRESLFLGVHEDVNSAQGRMAIRKMREEMERTEIEPFRAVFRMINVVWRKRNQEAVEASRLERLKQEAGLG